MKLRRALSLTVLLSSVALAACGAKQSGEPLQIQTGLLACTYADRAKDDAAPYVEGTPETPGTPTREAMSAFAAYDQSSFTAAIPLLEKVVSGETGDDEGNRQLAEYRLAVAEVQAARFDKAVEAFAPLVHKPSHLKHRDAAPWLARLMNQPLSSLQAIDLVGLYTDDDLRALDTPEGRPLLSLLEFGRARALYRKADFRGALRILERIRGVPSLAKIVDGCVAFATAGMQPR
ncbi:MAG: hypothetical protein U0414_13470 [Polyangiaceae bacterium]